MISDSPLKGGGLSPPQERAARATGYLRQCIFSVLAGVKISPLQPKWGRRARKAARGQRHLYTETVATFLQLKINHYPPLKTCAVSLKAKARQLNSKKTLLKTGLGDTSRPLVSWHGEVRAGEQ